MGFGYDNAMGKIHRLPPELINQIAAGEVVERPASVIKELVENAIDAGSTRIEVLARDGGRYLRVADNGCGMEEADLQLAFQNHATSKIQSVDDLFQLQTLGFRGEALASIAAVSKVTCMSRPLTASNGLKALVQPSGEVSLQPTGCAVGTIFEIQDLFYNVPARLKFLKRPQTELSHIHETLQMLALSHPEIGFHLALEDSVALKTSGSGDLGKALHEVFALDEADTLMPFDLSDPEAGYRVRGQTGTPNLTRGSRKWMMTFVNNRAVKCPILGKAVESAYDGLMVPGKFPVTVLFLDIPADEVDVNVHPTKKEVRYQKANTLFSFVRRGLDLALRQPGIDAGHSTDRGVQPAFQASQSYQEKPFASSPSSSVGDRFKPAFQSSEGPQRPAYTQAALGLYRPHPAGTEPADALPLPDYRIIGQLARTYILLENRDGLLIVDQHIAAERVLFERFSEQHERSEPARQPLLVPLSFPVSPAQAAALEENKTAFESLGFTYDCSDHTVQFSSVPSLYNDRVVKTSLEKLLAQLDETGDIKLSVTDVIATAACHAAVRAGDPLHHEQMQRVMDQWLRCQRPWTCPHGRPVSHLIPHGEMMSFFERPSLPV